MIKAHAVNGDLDDLISFLCQYPKIIMNRPQSEYFAGFFATFQNGNVGEDCTGCPNNAS